MKPGSKTARDEAYETEILELREELAARIAEADWLKGRYEAELRAAFAARPAASRPAKPARAEASPEPGPDREAMKRLQSELDRALAAEVRYLDRIEELKDQVERLNKDGPGT